MAKLKSYSNKQLRAIKRHWKALENLNDYYYACVQENEFAMAHDTGIEDIEFFKGECQGFVGVGNVRMTFKLWQPKY